LVPGNQNSVIVAALQEKESLVELESEEHEVLVDPEVIHFIPVHVKNVQETLEPQLFVLVVG
jgi:hypothetical protein